MNLRQFGQYVCYTENKPEHVESAARWRAMLAQYRANQHELFATLVQIPSDEVRRVRVRHSLG